MMRLAAIAISALILLPTTAMADNPIDVDALSKTPQALLEALDTRQNAYKTQKWTFVMTVIPVSGTKRSLKFNVLQKGAKRLVRFLSPGDVKGMSVLAKGSKMWVFSPQTENVRTVATSARRQTQLGSNFTYGDMSTVDLAPAYEASVDSDKGGLLWMTLKKKSDADADWPKLRVGVNKKHALVEVVEYWDGGKREKTQRRTDFAVMGGAPTWKTITMESADGLKTVLSMESQEINIDIPNKVFTKRSLVRDQ